MRKEGRDSRRYEVVVAGALLLCLAAVMFWEIMSNRSKRGWSAFQLTARDMASFTPHSDAWSSIREVTIDPTPTEPNIAAYELERPNGKVGVRLVHGYNMPDCMRLKHYTVELVMDHRQEETNTLSLNVPPGCVQLWKLTSELGDVTLWMTSMLNAGTFEGTDVDVRDMPFPRIGIPDDPNWVPRGFSWETFEHPVRDVRRFLNRKWNNARCDPVVFLKLKQPPWASSEMLTLVSAWRGGVVEADQEAVVTSQLLAAHSLVFTQLRAWRRRQLGEVK